MIRSFKHKGLRALWTDNNAAKVPANMLSRIERKLDALDAANSLQAINLPGFDFHPLQSFNPTRYAISVNGPWRLTFEFKDGDVFDLSL